MKTTKQLSQIRILLLLFMIALFLSGLTAIPIAPELRFLLYFFSETSEMYLWLNKVLLAYEDTDSQYPFLLFVQMFCTIVSIFILIE